MRVPARTWMRARRRTETRRSWPLLLVLVLSSCTPLYVPPVPGDLPPIHRQTRIADARVDRLGGTPAVVFEPREVAEEGWLAVQWFPPAGDAVASASVWLDAASIGHAVRVPFPEDVPREREGRWRAVLSADGRVLRQVEWNESGAGVLPAPAEED